MPPYTIHGLFPNISTWLLWAKEELLKRINEFAQNSHDTIVSQVRKFGASCDWSREAFTLDEKRNIAVNTVFKKMYEDGLIYRGYRVVNWDPKGQTTISDDEIVYEEREATLYTFKYSNDFPISISTTRPETKVAAKRRIFFYTGTDRQSPVPVPFRRERSHSRRSSQ